MFSSFVDQIALSKENNFMRESQKGKYILADI